MRWMLLLFAITLQAADLTFTAPPGGQRMLSQMTGKVVALEFGYSTCQPCKAESERLKKLTAEFGAQGFEAYAIAIDPNARAMSEAASTQGGTATPGLPLGWANARDVRNFLGYAASDRISVPQLVLLDRDGKIRYQTALNGNDPLRTDSGLRTRIAELLAPPPAAPAPAAAKTKKARK